MGCGGMEYGCMGGMPKLVYPLWDRFLRPKAAGRHPRGPRCENSLIFKGFGGTFGEPSGTSFDVFFVLFVHVFF